MQFENKVVAITGAAGGIGQELCRHFGREGAAIAALDRSETLTAFAEQLRARRRQGGIRRGRYRRHRRRHSSLRDHCRPARTNRYPDQQRRRVAQSEPRTHHAGRLQRRRRRQSEWRLQLRLRRAAGHEGAAGWFNRQHRLGKWARRTRRRRLQRRQGGLDQPDQGAGARIRPVQHPRQYRLPRHGPHAALGRAARAATRKCSHSSSAGIRSAASSSRSRSCARSPSSRPTPHPPSPARCCQSIAGCRPATSSWRVS